MASARFGAIKSIWSYQWLTDFLMREDEKRTKQNKGLVPAVLATAHTTSKLLLHSSKVMFSHDSKFRSMPITITPLVLILYLLYILSSTVILMLTVNKQCFMSTTHEHISKASIPRLPFLPRTSLSLHCSGEQIAEFADAQYILDPPW